jgi:hypothetical protein
LGKRGKRIGQPTAHFFQLVKEEKPSFSELPVTNVPSFVVFYLAPKRRIEFLARRRAIWAISVISDIFDERTHSLAIFRCTIRGCRQCLVRAALYPDAFASLIYQPDDIPFQPKILSGLKSGRQMRKFLV